jgi:hypothetical protein
MEWAVSGLRSKSLDLPTEGSSVSHLAEEFGEPLCFTPLCITAVTIRKNLVLRYRFHTFPTESMYSDRLCDVVVSGYRSRGPGFDSRPYEIFWEVVGLERGPLSLVRTIEELTEWKSSGSGLQNRDKRPWEFVALTTKVGIKFADKRRSLGRYSPSWEANSYSAIQDS